MILGGTLWITVKARAAAGSRQSDTQKQSCQLFGIIESSAETAVYICEGLHHCCDPDTALTPMSVLQTVQNQSVAEHQDSHSYVYWKQPLGYSEYLENRVKSQMM